MILRSITKHVKDQNWFAVFIDFLIVVVGVFIGIQVANWNDQQGVYNKETKALVALKKEIQTSITTTESKINSYQQATEAGKRSLAFIDQQINCEDNCWNRIVDFMHASQWQDLYVSDSSYQNMRNQGFPQSIEIIDAVEVYLAQNKSNAITFINFPPYRTLVRQLIDINASEFYWAECWSLIDGLEMYILDCTKGISDEQAKIIVDRILAKPNIKPFLTDWIGGIVSLPTVLGSQNIAAQNAIKLITEELERR
jgi:hypothetical protein